MYENQGKSDVLLGKGISPNDSLSSLTQEKFIVLNEKASLREVIDNLQRFHIGCVLLENDNKYPVYLQNGILYKILLVIATIWKKHG